MESVIRWELPLGLKVTTQLKQKSILNKTKQSESDSMFCNVFSFLLIQLSAEAADVKRNNYDLPPSKRAKIFGEEDTPSEFSKFYSLDVSQDSQKFIAKQLAKSLEK